MNEPTQMLSELLRPRQLSDLTLPQSVIDRFQNMIHADSVMNRLFYGQPGVGKAARSPAVVSLVA